MVLGNMDIGLNTANLAGIVTIIVLSVREHFRRQDRRHGAEHLHHGQNSRVARLGAAGYFSGTEIAQAIAANFGASFWHVGSHHVDLGVGGLTLIVALLAVSQVGLALFRRRLEQRYVYGRGEVKNPNRNLPLSLVLGTGSVILIYVAVNLIYMMVLPHTRRSARCNRAGARHTVRGRGSRGHRGDERYVRLGWRVPDGRSHPDLDLRGATTVLFWPGARVYYAMAKDGLFFSSAAKLHPKYRTPAASLVVQAIWTCLLCLSGTYGAVTGLHHFRRARLLHPDHCGGCSYCGTSDLTLPGHTGPSGIRFCPRSTLRWPLLWISFCYASSRSTPSPA